MSDYMKEAERLIAAHESAIRQHDRGAEWDEGPAKTLAALLAHIQRGAVAEGDDGKRVLREVFALCEDTEAKCYEDPSDFNRGRSFEAKGIARAIGAWYQEEFCGRTHMGEPAAPAPDHFRDAAKKEAAPAGVPMPKPVAYGFGNTAITGHTNRLMMVRIDIPGGDQYAGAFWLPLVLADEAHTYGVACRAAGEAAGYARGLKDAGSVLGVERGILEAALHGDAKPAKCDGNHGGPRCADPAPLVQNGEVLVTVTGLTGSGKSAIAGEIEIMCRALGLEVEWGEGAAEKHLTHADWTNALEMYRPRVRIVEANIPRTDAALLAHIQRGAVPEPEQIAKWAAGWRCIDESDGLTGEASMLDRIAHAVHGAMLAAAPSPDHFRDATRLMDEPAEVSMPQGYVERPSDYTGDIWIESQMRTYGDAREAAGYMRGLAVAGRDAERYRWLRDVSVPPHNFYLSVPDEFAGVRYTPTEVDAAIDAAIDALHGEVRP